MRLTYSIPLRTRVVPCDAAAKETQLWRALSPPLVKLRCATGRQCEDLTMTEAKQSPQGRIHGLDAYRAVLMMLGVVLHAAEPFIFIVTTMPHHAHYHGQFNTSELSENLIGLLTSVYAHFECRHFFSWRATLWPCSGSSADPKQQSRIVLNGFILPFIVCILISGFLTQSSLPELWHLWFLYTLMGLIPIASILAWLSKQLQEPLGSYLSG